MFPSLRPRARAESVAAVALAAIAAALWALTFRATRRGFFLADDSWFFGTAPFPLGRALAAFLTPVDQYGYYRPFPQLLWSITRHLGAREFTTFQGVTIALLAATSLFLFLGLRALFRSTPAATAAAAAYAFSLLHAKPLLWITLWFNTAEGLFTVANTALFVLHARTGRPWLRRCGLAALALAYSTNNGTHAWGLVPLAVDAIFLPAAAPLAWLRGLGRRALDHLLLTALFLGWLYGLNAPLARAGGLELDLAPAHLAGAFFSYLMATIAHLTGDGPAPAFFGQPPWLVALTLLAPAAAAVAAFLDRRFLLVWAVWLAGAAVICPLRDRWECEYATAMLPGAAMLLCGLIALLPRGLAWSGAALWVLLAFGAGRGGLPRFTADFLHRAEVNRAFLRTVAELDAAHPRSRPFLFVRADGPVAAAAPFQMFLAGAMPAFLPGRPWYVEVASFGLPTGVGEADSRLPAARAALREHAPLRLACGDEGCRALAERDR